MIKIAIVKFFRVIKLLLYLTKNWCKEEDLVPSRIITLLPSAIIVHQVLVICMIYDSTSTLLI